MNDTTLSARFSLARWGRRIFGWRLGVGLLAVVPAAFFGRPLSWPELPMRWRIFALTAIALGLGLRAWAAAHAGGHTRSGTIEAARLASSGPYAHLRNPIYLGTFILGLGMVALLGDAWLLPLHLVTFVILYTTIIPAEEQFLERTFGEGYRRYCREVPRVWPRLRPWTGRIDQAPKWRNAGGELRIGGVLVGIYGVLMWVGQIRE